MKIRKVISIVIMACLFVSQVASVAWAEEAPSELFEMIEESAEQAGNEAEAVSTPSDAEQKTETEKAKAAAKADGKDIILVAELDDVIVTLKADADAFEHEGELSLAVTPVDIENTEAEEELDTVEKENVAKRVTYDITVLDGETEIEPVKEVKVSFELKEAPSGADGVSIYHHDEEEGIEKIAAEGLGEDAEETDVTVEAATDSFSLYTVDFTYKEKTISISGDSTCNKLDDIVSELGIKEEVTEATAYQDEECTEEADNNEVKNEEGDILFSVYKIGDSWYVDAVNAFQTEHGLIIKTADGAEYKIKVTDAVAPYVIATAYIGAYDGQSHGGTVTTNIEGATIKYSTDGGSTYSQEAPLRKDAGTTTVKVKVTKDSTVIEKTYSIFIRQRDVQLTSGSAVKLHDGTPLINHTVTEGRLGFADGEGATYNNYGSQTEIGSSPNTFDYTLNPGTKLDNYNITVVNGTLVVTGSTPIVITAGSASKTYDGTALTSAAYSYTGDLVAGDELQATVEGSITDYKEYVEDNNTITSYKIMRGESDVTSQYAVVVKPGTLTINRRTLEITPGSATKAYDGNTLTCETYTIGGEGLAERDSVAIAIRTCQVGTLSQEERKVVGESDNVVMGVTWTPTTTGKNYDVTRNKGKVTITPKELTISGTVVADKAYDGNTVMSVSTPGSINAGIIAGDEVLLDTATATAKDKNAGNNKEVTVQYTLTGENADNYTAKNSTCNANITAKELTILGTTVADKIYDGTTTATVTAGTLQGIVGTDAVTVSAAGTFADANVGEDKEVEVTYTLSGADAGNYVKPDNETREASITAITTTVTLDPGAGTAGSKTSVTATSAEAMPTLLSTELPTRIGYIFAGYFDAATGGTKYYNADGTSAKNWDKTESTVTLYAQWTGNPNTPYTVQHYQQNVSDSGYTLIDTENLKGTTGEQTAAEAKSYPGFTADTFCQQAILGDGTTNVNVYYTRNIYTVTFKSDGQTHSTQQVKYGALLDEPSEPSKSSGTFCGWYKENTFENAWNFSTDTMPANGISLYAKWIYTVTFDANGGSGTMPSMTTSTGKIILPANGFTAPRGKKFAGWGVGSAMGEVKAPGTEVVFAEDGTVYAIWEYKKESSGGEWTLAPTAIGSSSAPVSNGTWAPMNGTFKYIVNGEPFRHAKAWITYTAADGKQYTGCFYFDKLGNMATGWRLINGVWYYFEPAAGPTQGIMYISRKTPDGYAVDAEGKWVQE